MVLETYLWLFASRPVHYAAGECSRVFSFPEHLGAVYKYMYHATGVLMRVFKGCMVPDFVGIENSQVSEVTLF